MSQKFTRNVTQADRQEGLCRICQKCYTWGKSCV